MSEQPATHDCFLARIAETPHVRGEPLTVEILTELAQSIAEDAAAAGLAAHLAHPRVRELLSGTIEGSPYLSGLMRRDPVRLARLLDQPPEATLDRAADRLQVAMLEAATIADAMAALRRFKTETALLVALADLAGIWPVMQVTAALTRIADVTVNAAVDWLFRQAVKRGDWHPADGDADPARSSGYIVLGMGKYGAFELNYSSDIDLIVFYDLQKVRLRDGLEPQAFFVRITRDLVKLMQERTGDGYVFRTDLRLRPDPGATQVALSTEAALVYYESFGQNWERAALIKSRPVAGDVAAGHHLLDELAPYIWRKYLDYAAIADIHAMKRQIHAYRGFGTIAVAGHNIKLGRGGIREIEFFTQTQQLIAGGRQKDLRVPATLAALDRLVLRGWIEPRVRDELTEAYHFLRRIEHRLQMVADEQTHELPAETAALTRLAEFAGYPSLDAFSAALVRRLETVQTHYAALFEKMPELTRDGVNMVFAGESDDPQTIEALARMGFSQPGQVIATVRGWHHGRYPAVSSPRARERLTEVQPLLIEALAETGDPDAALAGFDRFLSMLPAGVQLFSLLRANPRLLRVVADIMGSAPRLARILSKRRRVFDALLDPRVMGTLPSPADLDAMIAAELGTANDIQETLDQARVVGNEQLFLIGVRVLTGMIGASQAGGAYALLAERLIAALHAAVEKDFARFFGTVPGRGMAVVAMGKLGGHEMTAASDLDLIMIYDLPPTADVSTGLKPLPLSQYYSRLTQRLISALASPTAEGQLYDVDMRLRPSGQKGPVATQLTSFVDYQTNEAWTWEHMALTRARVVSGSEPMRRAVEEAITRALVRPRDRAVIAADVRDMRARIAAEKGTDNMWDLKQVRGGLVDIEFIAQYLQLVHAHAHPEVLDQNTIAALVKLQRAGLLAADAAEVLIPAARLVHDLTQVLRLTIDGAFDPAKAPDGVRRLLVRVGEAPSFARLEATLAARLGEIAQLFDRLVV
ncbi:MAG: bifunctional [glutamine synthetase] adenylyltransferase/[glutamine synthetase]-adenylyl-L-tyrosine phosphorylase [Hyphomicrobiaceae bacterium]